MAPQRKLPSKCEVCSANESKYTCSTCLVAYCSVTCYKKHKEVCGGRQCAGVNNTPHVGVSDMKDLLVPQNTEEPLLEEPKRLRPLTSLKWPYVPEESAYPDPLKRDDPKTLQLHHYEAIATSPAIRKTLAAHPILRDLLTSVDALRGSDREIALQRALGVTAPDIRDLKPLELSEDVLALRELAEAIESAVRGGHEGALGLDWGDTE
ncbi:hypothetical protein Hypma_002376 [Hypsizygus marmoreus]|uniref:HIT-type domain-containing protein n=1 Tax=Hypsizygus marmoreus TaxID=39966 RepID=A0A369JAS3_HYPMA|nr:hypothetical protein Hypma_002376 [Hypsizygus marmoreus]